MSATPAAMESPTISEEYWHRIFARNPNFCSWQTPKQLRVKAAVEKCLREGSGPLRVLDFGIGSLGLYRSLAPDLMRRMTIMGTSESLQHDVEDQLLTRYRIVIAVGPGLEPLSKVPSGSQDRVVCSYVFDYLSDAMRAQALGAFARVLKPGGKLILVLHHAHGERVEKFRRSQPYWHEARELYQQLLEARYAEASAMLEGLTGVLSTVFGHDQRYRGYLASYLKTAERFLSLFGVAAQGDQAVPRAALSDCERSMDLIGRQLAMTCEALRPIERPARDLPLPSELQLSQLVECADPGNDAPIAHVLTAVRVSGAQRAPHTPLSVDVGGDDARLEHE